MNFTFIILMILLIILCVILIITILLQTPKGGLSENLGINSQIFGIQDSNQFIERTTWTLVSIITLIIIITNIIISEPDRDYNTNNISKKEQKEKKIIINYKKYK